MRPFAHRRRAAVAAMLAMVGLAAAGCSAGTVSGRGAALGTSAETSPASTSSVDPSGFPSTGTTPSDSAGSRGASGSSATKDGVLVIDRAGHFRVRMPATPVRASQPSSFGSYHLTLHIAITASPYVAIVEGEEVTPPIGAGSYASVLRSVASGFVSGSGMKLVRQAATTFQGYTARTAVFESSGSRIEMVAFVYSGSQLYVLLAPPGHRFELLTGSFEPLF